MPAGPGRQSVSATVLARLCEDGGVPASVEQDPAAAIATTLERAKANDGVALVAGSHYLLGY